ncbi:MAG: nucleoside:proton symporter [Rhodospirillaceae bacterium]|nr:nucleoside:proton symporter [Rhodospirillaceae bacterium]MBT5455129.1 nucleoside:proton symporter [Rhodospirillaceae bacterium]
MQGLLGIAVLLLIAWAISEDRRAIPVRTLVAGLALQIALAFILLKLPLARDLFLALNDVVRALQQATGAGTSFVLGYLGGGDVPFETRKGASSFVLAFQALPLVLVISALSALLYHWRILPLVVQGFAWCLRKTLGIGGTAGVGTAANVFVGMVEAPLLVRPYLAAVPRSDLFVIMAAGMATIAGTMMVLYASFLQGVIANPLGHILTASILNAPAAIVVARLMIPPQPGAPPEIVKITSPYDNAMDAITRGTLDGLTLLLNIGAMLIVLVALVALANAALTLLPDWGGEPITLERLLGFLMAPIAWLIGIPWPEASAAGILLGTKIVLNELVAYLSMAQLSPGTLTDKSRLILTYALCGFANFASLGIMIGGLGAMVPDRRRDIVALGLRSIVAGVLSTCLTAALVGMIV